MIEIHPMRIEGNWEAGIALDYHTTSSTPTGYNEAGYMQFDTVRPEIAELLYRLKYKADQTAAVDIIAAAASMISKQKELFDVIVPVPPSAVRSVQPVLVIARGIAAATGLPIAECVTTTRPTTELKAVSDPEQRKALVDGLYAVDARYTSGRKVLLFDDLFRSGATMNAITDVLLGQGKATEVRVLTITKTRRNH